MLTMFKHVHHDLTSLRHTDLHGQPCWVAKACLQGSSSVQSHDGSSFLPSQLDEDLELTAAIDTSYAIHDSADSSLLIESGLIWGVLQAQPQY